MDKESFHNEHEIFTKKAYNSQGILPDRYVFVLTNLCNLRCDFCYQQKDARPDAMTTADWLALVKQLPYYARVTLCGGEPLAFSGFNEVFAAVASSFDCNIISNGLLLTEKSIDLLLSFPNFKVLSLSIDDLGDKLRGVNEKQWLQLVAMMKYFLAKRVQVGSPALLDIKTMVLDENAEELYRIYRYFIEEIGVDTHAFQFLKGSPIQHADHMYPLDQVLKSTKAKVYNKFEAIKRELGLIRQYNVKNNKTSFIHPKVDSLTSANGFVRIDCLNLPDHRKDLFQACKYPWSSVHINVDGELFPCLAVSTGNVKTTTLPNIINGQQFDKFKALIKQEGTVAACNRCGWLRPKEGTE